MHRSSETIGAIAGALAKAQGNKPGLARSVPDIGADADPFTGMAVGLLTFKKGQPPTFVQEDIGGTSLAAPLVAGIVTAAQAGQPAAFGFLDPAIYKLVGTSALSDTLPIGDYHTTQYLGVFCPTEATNARRSEHITTAEDSGVLPRTVALRPSTLMFAPMRTNSPTCMNRFSKMFSTTVVVPSA